MPRINITEHSDTYSYQTRQDAFGTVALPVCAIWGPVYNPTDPDENPDWVRFTGGYSGTMEFVRTFRGPNTTMGSREKSYEYALKLLASGYDILVKRCDNFGKRSMGELTLSPRSGASKATGTINVPTSSLLPPGFVSSVAQTGSFTALKDGALYNRLRVRVERISNAVVNETMEGKVTCYLYVYLVDGTESLLLEKTRFSYNQGPATVEGTTEKEITEWSEDEVTVNSSYIGSITLCGMGSTVNPDNTSGVFSGGSDGTGGSILSVRAKYPGTYGNQLKVRVKTDLDDMGRVIGVVEVFDRNGRYEHSDRVVNTDALLEQTAVAFDDAGSTDNRPMITEMVSNYLSSISLTNINLVTSGIEVVTSLVDGTDKAIKTLGLAGEGEVPASELTPNAIADLAGERFDNKQCSFIQYLRAVMGATETSDDDKIRIWMQQMCYHNALLMIPELTDPIIYDWDAVFCGIRDDQYVPQTFIDNTPGFEMEFEVTKMHAVLLDTAAQSKCGCAIIGTPFGMKRGTWEPISRYATGAILFKNELNAYVGQTLSTFGECVGPWCRTTLPMSGTNSWCCPEMAHLLLIISTEAKDGVRYWWLPPAGMVDTGVVYSPEYKIKKAYMDLIQNHDEGVCLNPLMHVPGKGLTCFGNSTLWDKPLGTYNALQNLSTRFLCNRVKQGIWNAALEILFKYNNNEAYTHFYALLSPLLDLMRSVGALNSTPKNPMGYRIIMNPDVVGLDHINANTIIGRVELAVQGVVDSVDVDLFLLPPNYFEEEGNS